MAIQDFFNSLAIVEKQTDTQSGMGGLVKVYSTRIASLPCRISTRGIREVDQFGKITWRRILRLYCSSNTTNNAIEGSDRIKLGSRTFEITGINNVAELDRHLEIDLKEIV